MKARMLEAGILLAIVAAAVPGAEPPSTDGTLVFRWKTPSVKISLSSSLLNPNPNIKTSTDVADVVRRSLSVWEGVSPIRFGQSVSEKQSVSPSGVAGDGVSLITIAQTPENLALFQNDPQSAAARTRVFYNRRGEITEADIVLNPFVQFSDDGTPGTFDLQSTLTHEIGHLLGLDHSFSLGATMFESNGRNGLFGLQARSGRILSPEDIAAIQKLYSLSTNDDSCCGIAAGRVILPVNRRGAAYQIWAEDIDSGRVAASTTSQRNGSYRLEGLPVGSYRIFAQSDDRKRSGMPLFETGGVDIEKGKTTQLDVSQSKHSTDIDVRFVGLNSQLAEAALPVNPGRTYVISFGGANLNAGKLTVGSNSKFVTVNTASISNFDFSDSVSAVKVEVTIDPEAPLGDYSLYLQNDTGNRKYVIGAVKVNLFVDPWDISSLFSR